MDRIDYERVMRWLDFADVWGITYRGVVMSEIELMVMSGNDMDPYSVY